MSGDFYPYPTLDEDGYELELIEQEEVADYDFPLPGFPPDEQRFGIERGALVKLIFRYKKWVEKDGQTITCERMWVEMVENQRINIVGRLDNGPQYTELLKSDDLVHFHPKHVVALWED